MKNNFHKALSIILTLLIVFTACFCAFGTASAAETTYYVKSDGDDNEFGSVRKPLATIAKVIELANEEGYASGDTVKIEVMDSAGVKWSAASEPINLPKHDFKLVITSDKSDGSGLVGTGDTNVSFGGEVDFKNVQVNFGASDKHISSNGYNITFDQDCQFYGDATKSYYTIGAYSDTNIYNEDYIFDTKIPIGKVNLGNYSSATTFDCNVNIKYNAASGSPEFVFGSTDGVNTYNKALNITVNAASVKFSARSSGVNFGTNAQVQILNNTPTALSTTDEGLSVVPDEKLWVYNNKHSVDDWISLTDTTGKLLIDTTLYCNVKAIDVTNPANVINEKDGHLVLPAGVYDITGDKIAQHDFINYYVDPDGIEIPVGSRPESAGSKKNPVRTVADATRLIAQDGRSENDVVTIHLKAGVRNYWRNENTADATYGLEPANYDCTAIIASDMEDVTAELYAYDAILLTGDLVLRNVDFTVAYQYADSCMSDYDLTIESTASFTAPYLYTWKTEYGKQHAKDQTIRVDGVLAVSYIALAAPYHSHKSTCDFNFYFNNPNSGCAIRFGPARNADGPNIYDGNININLRQAKTLSFINIESTDKCTINGGLNILVDDSVLLPYSAKTNFENVDIAGGKWFITNNASDDDFVSFTSKGVLSVKNGATAYSRQFGKEQVKHTGGTINLSQAQGAYTVSDKAIAPIVDDSHKMLYYLTGPTARLLATRAIVSPGETYIFEYSIYCNNYEDCSTTVRRDHNRWTLAVPEIISEEKIGDYYKVVCKATIPQDYEYDSGFFGVYLGPYAEGILFDRTVYHIDDKEKKDLFEGNQLFHDGLDYITLDNVFWGSIFTDSRGGKGLIKWQGGIEQLEILNFDLSKISEIIALNNPNDGKWWNDSDIIDENETGGTAAVKGALIRKDGTPIKGDKILLISDQNTFFKITDKNGEFYFKDVPIGFYQLFVEVNGKKVPTGFEAYLFGNETVSFNVICETDNYKLGDSNKVDYNEPVADVEDSHTDIEDSHTSVEDSYTNIEDTDKPTQEVVSTGNIKGTVFTPTLEVVSGLRIVLRGHGEAITDENGCFGFANVPVGDYELYAVNLDGSEYVFKTYTIMENVNIDAKLKYDPPKKASVETSDGSWIVWVIAASVVALLVVIGLAVVIVVKKKKVNNI